MSRREDGYDTYMELFSLGIELHFITEPHIDTSTYKKALQKSVAVKPVFNDEATNTLVSSILSAVNDYMVSLAKKQIMIAYDEAAQEARHLSERTKEGMAVAKIEGSKIGRQKGVTIQTWKRRKAVEKIKKHYIRYGGTLNTAECIAMCRVAKSTFYKYVEQIDKELLDEPAEFTYHSKKKTDCGVVR